MAEQHELNLHAPPPLQPQPRRMVSKPHLRQRRIVLFGAGCVVVLTALVFGLLAIFSPTQKPEAASSLPVPAAETKVAPALKVTEDIIAKGQTLSVILAKYGFSGVEIERIARDVKPVFNLNRIVAGRWWRFYIDSAGKVQFMEYALDDLHYLVITREGDGFAAEAVAYPFETRIAFIMGTIEDNPITAFAHRNEKDKLAMDMTDLFAWDIDFYTELRKGDMFRMVYEKKFLDGKFTDYGRILAAEFICQGRKFQAFRFEYPDTKTSDYFDRGAKSVRKEFLRSPIPYAPVTSRFSFSRLHPIRKVFTTHFGVDYGAPEGTPVHATADGVVVAAGVNGAAGNMIHLRHKNSYETMYLHLSRIYVNAGVRVEGGKTIGLVGNTGESTGPHLDYRIKQGGSYVNPLAAKFAPVAPLRPEFRDAFQRTVIFFDILLDAPFRLGRF